MTPEAFRASVAENRELILTERLELYKSAIRQAVEHLELNETIQAQTILEHALTTP